MDQPRDGSGRFITKAAPSSNGQLSKADTPDRRLALTELGRPTAQRASSSLYDDFLPQLRGRRAIREYQQMQANDATVGSLLFAVEAMFRNVEWSAEPADDTPEAQEAAEFLDDNMHGMSHSWADFIGDITTMLPYGWYFAETVYQLRDDGRIGWRKQAYRDQASLLEWVTDEHGGPKVFVQDNGRGGKVPIPIEKGLLFRTVNRGDPTGRSVLRNAWIAWKYKTRIQEFLVVGVERNVAGFPIAKIPAESLLARDDVFDEVSKLVTRIKKDEQAGVVWPQEFDDDSNPMYEFDMMGAGEGTGQVMEHSRKLAADFSTEILAVVLADFIRLGRDSVGSRALAEPKQEMFQAALEGWVSAIAGVLNRHAVPRLFRLNGMDPTLATVAHSPVQDVAYEELANAVLAIAQAGIGLDWADDPKIDNHFRMLFGLPAAEQNPDDQDTDQPDLEEELEDPIGNDN